MKWNYRCSSCGQWHHVPWVRRSESFTCPVTGAWHRPPSPLQQHDAYVDTHEWPSEMEDAVVHLKGAYCTVPGCPKRYETLDHRVPYSKGGSTSAANLWPMCRVHNQQKGDQGYEVWLLLRRLAV